MYQVTLSLFQLGKDPFMCHLGQIKQSLEAPFSAVTLFHVRSPSGTQVGQCQGYLFAFGLPNH